MEWSPQQVEAIEAVQRWLDDENGSQVFRLHGSAGTGKTTLAIELAKRVKRAQFAAYTGKAAHRMRMKGCAGASTIHSLIYVPADSTSQHVAELQKQLEAAESELWAEAKAEFPAEDTPEETIAKWVEEKTADLRRRLEEVRREKKQPFFRLREESPLGDADLGIFDECSMIDAKIGQDILSFGTRVLVLGDPYQLPPIRGEGFFGGTPDFLLTDIHRQAADSPIIKLAEEIRAGRYPDIGDYGDSSVIDWADVTPEMAQTADQIIVGKNATRRGCNNRMRQLLGRDRDGPLPVNGDRLICLRNDHEAGVLNGSFWGCDGASPAMEGRIGLDLRPLDGIGSAATFCAHTAYFFGQEPPYYEMRDAQCFDYGYAITAHKSQGSEFDDVLIFDESACFREHRWKWLYTAVTRAAKKVTLVKR